MKELVQAGSSDDLEHFKKEATAVANELMCHFYCVDFSYIHMDHQVKAK